jgi:hypothetical protein
MANAAKWRMGRQNDGRTAQIELERKARPENDRKSCAPKELVAQIGPT